MRLPTAKRHCTITLANGYAVSYATQDGVIDSPSTVPWQLLEDIAEALGFKGEPTAAGWEEMRTEQVALHVFRNSAGWCFAIGRRIGPNAVSYVDPTASFVGTWEAHRDWS